MAHFLIVILSCRKNQHLWAKLLQIHPQSIIFCGGFVPATPQQQPYLFDNGVLHLACNDAYEGLPEKVICLIDAVLHLPQFAHITHIIKIDDHDTQFDSQLVDNLQQVPGIQQHDYCGQKIQWAGHQYGQINGHRQWHFGKCSPESAWANQTYWGPYTPWVDGGCGYILSRPAMTLINQQYNWTNLDLVRAHHIYEDLMIALILYHCGIRPVLIQPVIRGDKK